MAHADPTDPKSLRKVITKLSGKHVLFIDAYMRNNCNPKDAAMAAGIEEKSASAMACKWLNPDKYPLISQEIARRFEERRNTTEVDIKRVVQETARIAFFDPRRLIKPDGKGVVSLKDMPDDVAAVVQSINIVYGEEEDNEGNFTRLKRTSVTPYDKLRALSLLATLLGADKDKNPAVNINVGTHAAGVPLSWDDLYKRMAAAPAEMDELEARIKAEEAKMLGPRVVQTETPKG